MRLAVFDRFASSHHGVVTADVAAEVGIDAPTWRRAIETGELERLHAGVARVAGSPRTREQRIMAGVAGAGTLAMASHRSSAHLWGIRRPEGDPVDVMLPRRTVQTRLDGVELHHPRDLADLRPIIRNGIPTTDPLRMLLDLGAVDPYGVPAAVDRVVRSRLASPTTIWRYLERHRKPGRSGVRALRAALEPWHIDGHDADSALESLMAATVTRFRLPPMEFHAIVEGFEVDFLVVGTSIVIECDGHESHGLDRDQFEFDRIRDAVLSAAGYVVVHVTWRQLERQPSAAARRIADVIRRWAPHLPAA